MKNMIEEFRNHFNDVVESVERYDIFVRGREFQEQSLALLRPLLNECRENKERAIKNSQEDAANAFLAFEYMAASLMEEFRFYLALKDDKVDQAWDHLINAESAAANAMKSHQVAAHLTNYIERLDALESLLFPKPAFFSTGWVVHRSECSICGVEYGECDHIKGRPYMGQLCARVVKEGTAKEVSVVSDPADKHCRAMHFSDDDKWRNAFTHRIVPPESVDHPPKSRTLEGRIS